jgi:hypothetical protein
MFAKQRERWLRKGRKQLSRLQERWRAPELKNRGYCPICERSALFIARDPWLRDHYKCQRCRSIPRERALMLVVQQHFPNWRDLTIHESSPVNRGASKREELLQLHSNAVPRRSTLGFNCRRLQMRESRATGPSRTTASTYTSHRMFSNTSFAPSLLSKKWRERLDPAVRTYSPCLS